MLVIAFEKMRFLQPPTPDRSRKTHRSEQYHGSGSVFIRTRFRILLSITCIAKNLIFYQPQISLFMLILKNF